MVLLYGKVLINHHSSNIQKPRVIKRVIIVMYKNEEFLSLLHFAHNLYNKKKFVSSISFFEIYILWSNSDIKCLIIIAPQWPPEVIWDTLWMFKNNSRDNLVIHWTFSQHKTGLRNQKFFAIMSSSHFIQITRLIGLIMKVFYLLNSLDGFSMYRLYNENNIFETGLDMIEVKSVFWNT